MSIILHSYLCSWVPAVAAFVLLMLAAIAVDDYRLFINRS